MAMTDSGVQLSNLLWPGAEEEQARLGQGRAGQGHQTGNLELENRNIQSRAPSVRYGLGNRPGLSPNICKKNDTIKQ